MAPTTKATTKASLGSLLFHPKKKPQPKQEPSERRSVPNKPNGTPKPSPKPMEVDEEFKLPEGPYSEFRLMSSASHGWKYDVMKFDSRKTVDISTWKAPIKLNRKEPRRDDQNGSGVQEAVGPMLGSDGKPVIGSDGRIVMVDSEGRPIQPGSGEGGSNGNKDTRSKGMNGKKKFQKKSHQVFPVPEATRQLRREERHPWVIEDAEQKEVWVGKLEEVSKSETHAFFMPAADDIFKFVPAHRWYKFQKKPNYHIPNLEEAEKIMAQMQKNKDPERWLLHNRNGKAPSAATSAIFKGEAQPFSGSLVHTSGQSLGPGGRRLKTVDNGGDLFGEDDEDGEGRRRRRDDGADGDIDEMVYEEDFADDDEKIEDDGDDEEAKELEERLKREYKNANKQRDGYIDDSDEDENEGQLTKDGKAMKKLIRNLEKNNAYDSDEERNPYASSEDEEEEEQPPVASEPAIQQQPQQSQPASRSGSHPPSKSGSSAAPRSGGSRAGSRAPSPAPSSPTLGGHSIVAKRATSPKAPKTKGSNASRGTSPLAAGQSRASSPNGSRATSPVAGSGSNRQGSPTAAGKGSNKRKATDEGSVNVPPKPKKRKSQGLNAMVPVGSLQDSMLIDWLKNTPNATTRDCISHFTPYLTDEAKKSKFTTLVKEVAQLRGGNLKLRDAYRGDSMASQQ